MAINGQNKMGYYCIMFFVQQSSHNYFKRDLTWNGSTTLEIEHFLSELKSIGKFMVPVSRQMGLTTTGMASLILLSIYSITFCKYSSIPIHLHGNILCCMLVALGFRLLNSGSTYYYYQTMSAFK